MGKGSKPREWSGREEQILRSHYGRKSVAELAIILGRTKYAVATRARDLGIGAASSGTRRPWSLEDERYLQDNYHIRTAKEIAEHLGRTERSVISAAERFYLQAPGPLAGPGRLPNFSAADDDYIRASMHGMAYSAIAEALGKSERQVANRANYLGLTRRSGNAVARWQSRMGLTDRIAAARLGMTLANYQILKRGVTLKGEPREANLRTLLACSAIEAGLEPIA